MTREETVKIIRIMVDSYPNYKPNNLSETVDVWNMMLEEYSYPQVSMALKSYILSDTSGFAPAIGQLIDMIYRAEHGETPNVNQAWNVILEACDKAKDRSAKPYWEALPEDIKRAVGGIDAFIAIVHMSNSDRLREKPFFEKCYTKEANLEMAVAKLPQEIKAKLPSRDTPSLMDKQKAEPEPEEEEMSDEEWIKFMDGMTEEEFQKWRGDD